MYLHILIIILHSMNFGLFYGAFYVEVGNFSGPKLEGKNTTAWYFCWRKKKRFSLETGHLLMPALCVVNLHRNQRGWYHLFIFDAPWFHLRKRHVADTTFFSSTHCDSFCEKDSMNAPIKCTWDCRCKGKSAMHFHLMMFSLDIYSNNISIFLTGWDIQYLGILIQYQEELLKL